MKPGLVKRFRKSPAMAVCAAALFKRALRLSSAPFIVALPGGKTPLILLKTLAACAVPWERVHFFMSDERLVPSGSGLSNFEQARRHLFSKISIPPENLHPVKNTSAYEAAAAYEKELKRTAGSAGIIDLVFLGLGEDGHTASLFAGSPAFNETRLIAPSLAPAGTEPRRRVTLTASAINRAATVVLMAAGPAKKTVFYAAAKGDKSIPAGRLKPRGRYFLFFAEHEEKDTRKLS